MLPRYARFVDFAGADWVDAPRVTGNVSLHKFVRINAKGREEGRLELLNDEIHSECGSLAATFVFAPVLRQIRDADSSICSSFPSLPSSRFLFGLPPSG